MFRLSETLTRTFSFPGKKTRKMLNVGGRPKGSTTGIYCQFHHPCGDQTFKGGYHRQTKLER